MDVLISEKYFNHDLARFGTISLELPAQAVTGRRKGRLKRKHNDPTSHRLVNMQGNSWMPENEEGF
jgi:hypothetical protein